MSRILVSPSLLACDFGRLAEEVQQVEEAGADWLHVDVMDGHFVPNLTIGPVVVEAIRRASHVPLDVHLMLNHPEQYLKPFIDAGAHYLTVHVEAPGLRTHAVLEQTLGAIRKAGARAGLSLRPRTAAEAVKRAAWGSGIGPTITRCIRSVTNSCRATRLMSRGVTLAMWARRRSGLATRPTVTACSPIHSICSMVSSSPSRSCPA